LGALNLAWQWVAVIFAAGTGLAYLPEFMGWRYIGGRPKNNTT
jgi:hypothetical protein